MSRLETMVRADFGFKLTAPLMLRVMAAFDSWVEVAERGGGANAFSSTLGPVNQRVALEQVV
jgi:hypothetical protein